MIRDEHVDEVAHRLWVAGVMGYIEEERIFKVDGKPAYMGLFGVERPKDPVTAFGPGLRVIQNCVPLNCYLVQLAGDIDTLPACTKWMTMVLHHDELCWLFSEDQKACFHLYALPEAWRGFFVLGNSFACISIGRIVIACKEIAAEARTAGDLWARWLTCEGLDVSVLHITDPPLRPLTEEEVEEKARMQELSKKYLWTARHQAVYSHIRSAGIRGTDVRLNPSSFYRASAWPRQSIAAGQWIWQPFQSYAFHRGAHINVFELRSIMNVFRHRAKEVQHHRTKCLFLTDSQVALSVAAKGRSSSLQLNAILRRLAGILLSTQMYVYYGWVRTDDNPADHPSRVRLRCR